jgi:hypothetical protein
MLKNQQIDPNNFPMKRITHLSQDNWSIRAVFYPTRSARQTFILGRFSYRISRLESCCALSSLLGSNCDIIRPWLQGKDGGQCMKWEVNHDDFVDMLVWGGVGTHMDVELPFLLGKWATTLTRKSAKRSFSRIKPCSCGRANVLAKNITLHRMLHFLCCGGVLLCVGHIEKHSNPNGEMNK